MEDPNVLLALAAAFVAIGAVIGDFQVRSEQKPIAACLIMGTGIFIMTGIVLVFLYHVFQSGNTEVLGTLGRFIF